MFPACAEEARLGMPAHRKRGAAVQHPRPIDTLVNFRGEILDFLVGKILPSGQYAAKKQGSINGRQFGLVPALAGFHVDEVIVKTVLVLEVVREKTKRAANALENFLLRAKAAMVADAEACQTKASGGDARHGARVVPIRQRAVFHLPRFRARLKPEKIERCALNFVQQFFVGALIRRSSRLDEFLLRSRERT